MRYLHELVEHPKLVPAKILHQRFYPSKKMKQHYHEEIELVVPLNGYMTSWCNGESKKIIANQVCITNHNTIHYFTFPSMHPEGIEVITILLSYQALKECFEDIDNYDLEVNQQEFLLLEKILKIDSLYTSKSPFYKVSIHGLLYELYAILLTHCLVEKTISDIALPNASMTQKITAYIAKQYSQPLSLQDIGNTLGFSPTYISRHFKESCGITISEYIRKVRLQHSYEDLLNTNLSITTIALENGFPNVKSFITAFKQMYQCTPLEYRKAKRAINDQKR